VNGLAGRVFIASFSAETNSFSPIPTGMQAFEEGGLFVENASQKDPQGVGLWMKILRDLAEGDGNMVCEGLRATAEPGSRIVRAVYEDLRDRLVEQAARARADILILALHGAMMADGYDDCEGDLLARVRDAVQPGAVIGVVLDPHCHLTAEMLGAADITVLMKEYPHTDFAARASEVYTLCRAVLAGEITPTHQLFDCRMIGHYPTMLEPMASIVGEMREAERAPAILSASFVHGFPWGDSPDNGSKMLVITDNDPVLAASVAKRLGMRIYEQRAHFALRYPPIQEALDLAAASAAPVVLADTADNAGGGAPGDATPLLRAMLARPTGPSLLGAIYDPGAVRLCREAGIGATLTLRIGGKIGTASGDPLDAVAQVVALAEAHVQTFANEIVPMGPSAWIQIGDVGVVLCSIRSQVFSPDLFTGLGMTLHDKHLIAVKSSEHYRAAFAPVAGTIIPVATPGALQTDLTAISYRLKRDRVFYPAVPDPLGLGPPGTRAPARVDGCQDYSFEAKPSVQ